MYETDSLRFTAETNKLYVYIYVCVYLYVYISFKISFPFRSPQSTE